MGVRLMDSAALEREVFGEERIDLSKKPLCSVAPEWEPDDAATNCRQCGQPFTSFLRRRHHCRHCGRVFCEICTKSDMPIPKFGLHDPVRVCDACVSILEQEQEQE